jgi:hypothetical protein
MGGEVHQLEPSSSDADKQPAPMKHHRCPTCGRHVGWRRLLGSWIWTTWRCPRCAAHLKVNMRRRMFSGVLGLACVMVAVIWDFPFSRLILLLVALVPIDAAIEGVQVARDTRETSASL